ncbi:MAG: hypothetical protein AAB876_00435 [Patescibacteria group bacterium]
MCPACILTIGGGLLVAKKLGVNDILVIGLLTVFLYVITDIILRKINKGKVFFPYQRVIITVTLLLTIILIFKII